MYRVRPAVVTSIVTVLAAAAITAAMVVATQAARRHGDSSLVGANWTSATVQVVAAAALAAVGADRLTRPGRRLAGAMLLAAAAAYPAAVLPAPFVRSPTWFTVALATSGFAPVLCVGAALAWPRTGRLILRSVLALAVVPAALTGPLPALVLDPRAAGCGTCPADLFAVTSRPDLHDSLVRAGLVSSVAWCGVAIIVLAVTGARLTRPDRPVAGPVLVAGAAVAAATLGSAAHALTLPTPEIDATTQLLWTAGNVSAVALAAAVAGAGLAARRSARRLTRRLVTAGADVAALRATLAGVVGDADLQVVLNPATAPARRGIQLTRGADRFAEVSFAPRFAEAMPRAVAATRAAALALEVAAAHDDLTRTEERLRESRRRIVEVGDAARHEVERNLHDGAQQRLVALAIDLAGLRRRTADPDQQAALATAQDRIRSATEQLRDISHGLFPAALADQGLVAALRDYQTRSPVAVELDTDRFAEVVPMAAALAAYRLVVDAVRSVADRAHVVTVTLAGDDTAIRVALVGDAIWDERDLQHAFDRFDALDGELVVDHHRIEGRLPCGS